MATHAARPRVTTPVIRASFRAVSINLARTHREFTCIHNSFGACLLTASADAIAGLITPVACELSRFCSSSRTLATRAKRSSFTSAWQGFTFLFVLPMLRVSGPIQTSRTLRPNFSVRSLERHAERQLPESSRATKTADRASTRPAGVSTSKRGQAKPPVLADELLYFLLGHEHPLAQSAQHGQSQLQFGQSLQQSAEQHPPSLQVGAVAPGVD